jgi:hypothetical protein
MTGPGRMPLVMVANNFAGASSCAAQLARIEMHAPSNSSAPENLPEFRRGASSGHANE